LIVRSEEIELPDTSMSSQLSEQTVAPNPFAQFKAWFDDVKHIPDANAMTLATATRTGKVSARIVLMKEFDERGFCFFTNFTSAKGKVLAQNPRAALVFFWQPVNRQVRIVGVVKKMSRAEADAYFATRPIGSRIGAWASPQSEPIADRTLLERRTREFAKKFGAHVPRPPHWGGYRVVPESVEFWQGRENRLHDRLVYRRTLRGWSVVRLAP
jgi:pyridoxamine 5'-phosphate oxidase